MRCACAIQAAIILGIGLLIGCQPTPPAAQLVPVTAFSGSIAEISARLEHANVDNDVAQALRAGDRRPLGVMGIGLVVPGIDRVTLAAMSTEVQIIPHTTDSVYSAQLMEFQDIAYRYA